MLILLLSLQNPVCCDVIISGLALSPDTGQSQPSAQLPTPVKEKTETVIIKPARAVAEISKAVMTKPAKPRTVVTRPMTAADTTVFELAAIAPASVPTEVAGEVNENIKSDASASIATAARTGFTKIAHSGEALDIKALNWACVEDKSSRLTWEVKENNGGIHDRDYSYSWLTEINGERRGKYNGGRCKGSTSCDTSAYIVAINSEKLCGYSDWRLPTRAELESLVEYNDDPKQATINKDYFPETVPSWYWTASEHPHREAYAWYVLFRNGVALNDLKERPKHIRLVRANTQQ